jgi:polycystin 2
LTAEEKAIEDEYLKENRVTPAEFRIITQRVDVMEHSMGNIVNKIDAVLTNLENVEKAKIKRREAMAKILEKLNDVNSIADDEKRATLQKMVKEELDSWESKHGSGSPSNMDRVPSASYSSRAASPPNSSLDNVNIRKKSAWRQQ